MEQTFPDLLELCDGLFGVKASVIEEFSDGMLFRCHRQGNPEVFEIGMKQMTIELVQGQPGHPRLLSLLVATNTRISLRITRPIVTRQRKVTMLRFNPVTRASSAIFIYVRPSNG